MNIPVFDELKHLVILSGLSPGRVAHDAGVSRETIDRWLDGRVHMPRIDTMLKVAAVVGRHVELTPTVKKMVAFYPPPKLKPPRMALWWLQ